MAANTPLPAAADLLLPPRTEPKRDQYGRYLLPDPVTGDEKAWTRVSKLARTIADTYRLERWKMKNVALGMSLRSDLVMAASAIEDPESRDGKQKLAKIVDQAVDRVGASAKSNIGTALHSFTERIDVGRPPKLVPSPYDKDLDAYKVGLRAHGIEVSPRWLERIVIVPELLPLYVAGQLDRVVRYKGRYMIGDLKTGADLFYGSGEIAAQLACYAHAKSVWDMQAKRYYPMLPGIDRETALVFHLPAGEGRLVVYKADIKAGWEGVQLALQVRAWQGRHDFLTELGPEG